MIVSMYSSQFNKDYFGLLFKESSTYSYYDVVGYLTEENELIISGFYDNDEFFIPFKDYEFYLNELFTAFPCYKNKAIISSNSYILKQKDDFYLFETNEKTDNFNFLYSQINCDYIVSIKKISSIKKIILYNQEKDIFYIENIENIAPCFLYNLYYDSKAQIIFEIEELDYKTEISLSEPLGFYNYTDFSIIKYPDFYEIKINKYDSFSVVLSCNNFNHNLKKKSKKKKIDDIEYYKEREKEFFIINIISILDTFIYRNILPKEDIIATSITDFILKEFGFKIIFEEYNKYTEKQLEVLSPMRYMNFANYFNVRIRPLFIKYFIFDKEQYIFETERNFHEK